MLVCCWLLVVGSWFRSTPSSAQACTSYYDHEEIQSYLASVSKLMVFQHQLIPHAHHFFAGILNETRKKDRFENGSS